MCHPQPIGHVDDQATRASDGQVFFSPVMHSLTFIDFYYLDSQSGFWAFKKKALQPHLLTAKPQSLISTDTKTRTASPGFSKKILNFSPGFYP